ncbi:MAG: branched-chain amino acid ABC transporter permease [Ardenticatenaceae bacterium]|nr:branched-chain amino acid ABC transporter permease [Ardenticatenaceae bacterium]MCB9443482.1 branched-chain amino acid ABC transporter permease [Ardenticatenaceae bacterium]
MSTQSATKSSRKILPGWLRDILLDWDKTQLLISFTILLLIALSPLVVKSPYYMGIIILTTLYIFTGISWNIVAGFTGQLLIAHIIFIAFGAYTTVVLANTYGISPWIGIPIGGIVAALTGVVMAFITLRYGLKLDYFALFTIALLIALRTLFLKWEFVGGAIGMWFRLNEPSFAKMIFSNKEPYLYIILGLVVVGILIQYQIYRSKLGKYLMAIREDEDAAAALGINTSFYKTLAVVIGAALAGIGGGFYVIYVTFVDPPQVFNLGMNVEIVMAGPIIGGLGSLAGPVLGAVLNKPFAELMRGLLSAERSGSTLIVYGSFLIIAILFLPRGVTGVVHNVYLKARRRLMADQS